MTKGTKRTKGAEGAEGDLLCKHDSIMIENRL